MENPQKASPKFSGEAYGYNSANLLTATAAAAAATVAGATTGAADALFSAFLGLDHITHGQAQNQRNNCNN